jgi:hypothetical protein
MVAGCKLGKGKIMGGKIIRIHFTAGATKQASKFMPLLTELGRSTRGRGSIDISLLAELELARTASFIFSGCR